MAIVKLGLRTARLTNFPHLYSFSQQSVCYSHSWRAGARKDSEREVRAGSHRIQFTAKRDRSRFHGHIGPTSQKIQSFETNKPGFVQ